MFNEIIYKQTKGVPMGSPVSSVLAEYKLRKIENKFVNENQKLIKLWTRYVDDIFLVTKKKELTQLFQRLNQTDPNIKFTCEQEEEGVICYLDIKIMRNEQQGLNTTIHRKSTCNTEIINAKCKTPRSYKLAPIRSLVDRAILICSNSELLNKELENIYRITERAGFNKTIVNKIIKSRQRNIQHIQSAQKQKPKITNAIPYDRGLGNKIQHEVAKYGVTIPIRPNPNIFNIIRTDKEKINIVETAGIYKIPFYEKDSKTPSGFYIGQTKRKIKTRLEEHIKSCRNLNKASALAEKYIEDDVRFEFEETTKLANYNSWKYALIREAIEILTERQACNRMEHFNIDDGWKKIMRRHDDRDAQKGTAEERGRKTSEREAVREFYTEEGGG